jgi:adenosylmethionine-8-amino-7-oxononanoate aminotransferase
VRGAGLLIGLELVSNKETKEPFPVELDVAHRVEKEAFNNGLVVMGGMKGMIDGVAGDHLELTPPYIIEEEHVDFIATTLHKSISNVISQLPIKEKSFG